jgi:hypothetical protein
VLFHEAIEDFSKRALGESFVRFARAAAKGHEGSIFVVSVVKGLKMDDSALIKAFVKADEPLGWYIAGMLSDRREAFDFCKKSAEGGCSWGQVEYGWCFEAGHFVEQDEKVYLEWLEKAAKQNNPDAMHRLGRWFGFEGGKNKEKALSYYRVAAELGWKTSMRSLAVMLRDGEGCAEDLKQATIWSAKGKSGMFWETLEDAKKAFLTGKTDAFGCDFNQFCYVLGWGLYWCLYRKEQWDPVSDTFKDFIDRCLDYYCSCVELQQKSVVEFLLCWNREVGVKDVGVLIGKMVWEGREDNLVKMFWMGRIIKKSEARNSFVLSRCLCLRNGDGDEREDAGEEGGEWGEEKFFVFSLFVFR